MALRPCRSGRLGLELVDDLVGAAQRGEARFVSEGFLRIATPGRVRGGDTASAASVTTMASTPSLNASTRPLSTHPNDAGIFAHQRPFLPFDESRGATRLLRDHQRRLEADEAGRRRKPGAPVRPRSAVSGEFPRVDGSAQSSFPPQRRRSESGLRGISRRPRSCWPMRSPSGFFVRAYRIYGLRGRELRLWATASASGTGSAGSVG